MGERVPRPRPFDELFGELPSSSYIVEPARAVTTVSPPAPVVFAKNVPPPVYVVEAPHPLITVPTLLPNPVAEAALSGVHPVELSPLQTTVSSAPPIGLAQVVPSQADTVEPIRAQTIVTTELPTAIAQVAPYPVCTVKSPRSMSVVMPPRDGSSQRPLETATKAHQQVHVQSARTLSESGGSPPNHSPQRLSAADDGNLASSPHSIDGPKGEVESEWVAGPQGRTKYMTLLRKAREAHRAGDRTKAADYMREARSLDANARRGDPDERPAVWVLFSLFAGIVLGIGFVIAMTDLADATIFQVPVDPLMAMLLQTMGWGSIGGACGAMRSMLRGSERRKSDRTTALSYFARPVLGALFGAELYLLLQVALLFADTNADQMIQDWTFVTSIPLSVVAALGGFKLQVALEFSERFFRRVFQIG